MEAKPSPHPEWATKHRTKGTELRHINGKYYLYAYKTVYDKEKKKPRKISGGLIGAITVQDGLIPSSKRALETAADKAYQRPLPAHRPAGQTPGWNKMPVNPVRLSTWQ